MVAEGEVSSGELDTGPRNGDGSQVGEELDASASNTAVKCRSAGVPDWECARAQTERVSEAMAYTLTVAFTNCRSRNKHYTESRDKESQTSEIFPHY